MIATVKQRIGISDSAYQWRDIRRVPAWDRRTETIAALIPPGSCVLEFGAHSRYLETLLEDCEYIPSDVWDRGPDTIVCDLNQPLPALPEVDVIVFGGVLEHLELGRTATLLSVLHAPLLIVGYHFGGNYEYDTKAAFIADAEAGGWSLCYEHIGGRIVVFEGK